MAYGDLKNLDRKTFTNKVLRDKAFNIAKDRWVWLAKYDGYQRGLASMVYKFFDKKAFGSGVKNENISNKELAKQSHKPIIWKLN